MCEATLSSVGHTSGDSPASNLAGPPIQGISCGMVIGAPFSTLVMRLEQNVSDCIPVLHGLIRPHDPIRKVCNFSGLFLKRADPRSAGCRAACSARTAPPA